MIRVILMILSCVTIFFDSEDANRLVSNVDIDFLVDHIEPLEVLAWTRDAVN